MVHIRRGITVGTLTKKDIIESCAISADLDSKTASEGFETFVDIIKEVLQKGEDVSLSGFGKFFVREKNKRRGRNPKTGEEIFIAPRRSISFFLSKTLRAKLEGNTEE
jgi:integration host factor subunit alpha